MLKYKVKSLVSAYQDGDVNAIAHQANCFCAMGAGIAPVLARAIPPLQAIDSLTDKGDRNKMGKFTAYRTTMRAGTDTEEPLWAYNLYGQYNPGMNTAYDSLGSALRGMSIDLYSMGGNPETIKVGFPKLGCGIGGGDWKIVEGMIEKYFSQFDVTIFVLSISDVPEWVCDGEM